MKVKATKTIIDYGKTRSYLQITKSHLVNTVTRLMDQMTEYGWLTMPSGDNYKKSLIISIDAFLAKHPVTMYAPGSDKSPPEPTDGINPPASGWAVGSGGPPENWLLTAAATCLFWYAHLQGLKDKTVPKETYE